VHAASLPSVAIAPCLQRSLASRAKGASHATALSENVIVCLCTCKTFQHMARICFFGRSYMMTNTCIGYSGFLGLLVVHKIAALLRRQPRGELLLNAGSKYAISTLSQRAIIQHKLKENCAPSHRNEAARAEPRETSTAFFLLAPRTNGPRDVPRCGVLRFLQKTRTTEWYSRNCC
jgi:hypothetical protein